MLDLVTRPLRTLILAVTVSVVAGLVMGWLWARPREHVALPGPESTPAVVVAAYIAALNARDFDTSNALVDGGGLPTYSRLDRAPTYDELRILEVAGGDGQPAGREEAYVRVTFVYDGNGDFSLEDGPTDWGYVVRRATPYEPWRVVDSGVS